MTKHLGTRCVVVSKPSFAIASGGTVDVLKNRLEFTGVVLCIIIVVLTTNYTNGLALKIGSLLIILIHM
jgi:hypothetical protein